jgi:SulP family sulfate permease
MRLQGFIFFGTADTLYSRIGERLEGARAVPLNYLILDFRDVTGMDSTARMGFMRMIELARRQSLTLVFTSSSAGLEKQWADRDVESEGIHFFGQLDQGLEWCEEQLLASAVPDKRLADSRQDELERRLGGPVTMRRLLAHFERMEVKAGDVLMRQGEPSDMIFLMESGQITAYREKEDGSRERLQTMRDWNVVGEVGFFLGTRRTATVIAERRGVLYRASRTMLTKIRDSDPDVAVVLHQLIIELLAERVTHLVTVVDALRR